MRAGKSVEINYKQYKILYFINFFGQGVIKIFADQNPNRLTLELADAILANKIEISGKDGRIRFDILDQDLQRACVKLIKMAAFG